MSIIDGYMKSLRSGSKVSQFDIRSAVEQTVFDLKTLNSQCDDRLIETDQREDICQLLLVSAQNAGLDTRDDITEEWRTW